MKDSLRKMITITGILVILSPIFFSCSNQLPERKVTYYPNGQMETERFYKNGKQEGTAIGWWEDGKQKFEFHFENDVFEGEQKQWNKEGLLYTDFNYKDGFEQGLQRMWYPDGKIQANYVAKDYRKYGLTGVKNCTSTKEDIK